MLGILRTTTRVSPGLHCSVWDRCMFAGEREDVRGKPDSAVGGRRGIEFCGDSHSSRAVGHVYHAVEDEGCRRGVRRGTLA